jgi:hypothetical protein
MPGERVEENHIRSFDGNGGPRTHGDTNISSLQRGRIIDAIAGHCH